MDGRTVCDDQFFASGKALGVVGTGLESPMTPSCNKDSRAPLGALPKAARGMLLASRASSFMFVFFDGVASLFTFFLILRSSSRNTEVLPLVS